MPTLSQLLPVLALALEVGGIYTRQPLPSRYLSSSDRMWDQAKANRLLPERDSGDAQTLRELLPCQSAISPACSEYPFPIKTILLHRMVAILSQRAPIRPNPTIDKPTPTGKGPDRPPILSTDPHITVNDRSFIHMWCDGIETGPGPSPKPLDIRRELKEIFHSET